jgi:hypothetical protein
MSAIHQLCDEWERLEECLPSDDNVRRQAEIERHLIEEVASNKGELLRQARFFREVLRDGGSKRNVCFLDAIKRGVARLFPCRINVAA